MGRQRPNFLGTFCVSSVGTSEIVYAIHPLTTLVSYGTIEPDGAVDVTFSFDHRVFDGMTIARGLAALETILDGVIANEVAGPERV
jgi:pyruvate/2-oxoglutarate dehydrogenase complex dihydrolipoamide acyltransferase (E2) component